MNHHCPQRTTLRWPALALATLLLAVHIAASAAPGAHGPNGEHLDAPNTASATSALPRVEANSELFELVATLQTGGLSILIDRYVSNEPVLGAQLEVESGGLKAQATFQADLGHYAIDDPKLLALLRTPGEHALVFTLVAGPDSDLLDGTLRSTATSTAAAAAGGAQGHGHAGDDHGQAAGHAHGLERAAWIGGGVALLGLIGSVAWWRQRRRAAGMPQGVL